MIFIDKIKKSLNIFFNGELRFIKVAAISAFFILITLICAFSEHESDSEISLYYSPSENGAVIFFGSEKADDTVPGRSVAAVKYSENKTSCAVLMSEGSSYSLFSISGGNVNRVAADCTNSFTLSYSGSSVVYLSSDGKMNYYSVNNQRIESIDENITGFAVSPNGKSVLYSKNDGAQKLYIYTDSVSRYIGDNYTPLALTDNCEYIYVLAADDSLCLIDTDGDMKARLCSSVDDTALYFSNDLTSAVFSDGSYTYVSHEGKSRIRLVPYEASPVIYDEEFEIFCNSDNTAKLCGDNDLCGIYYRVSDGNGNSTLFYITEDNARIDVAEETEDFVPLKNSRLVYMTPDGKVYSCKKGEPSLLFEGASSIEPSSDGKYIYYLNNAADLQVWHGGKTEKLAAGVKSFYMTSWNEVLFILNDLKLYSVSKAGDSDLLDENVYGCDVGINTAFYCSDYNSQTGVFDLFCADKKNKFVLSYEGAAHIM